MSQRKEVLARAEALLKQTPFSKQNEAMVNSLLRLADALPTDAAEERSSNAAAEELRARAAERSKVDTADIEFREFVGKPSIETRTYSALASGQTPGSYLVPLQWRAEYQKRLASSSGWLKAGATVQNTDTGRKYLSFFADDTATTADIIPENTGTTLANPVLSQPSPDLQRFATSTLLSRELWQDMAFDASGFLQNLFATRVARKFNNFASVDGTYGLFAQLNAPATSSSSSVPTLAELVQMQDPSVIDPAYREADSEPCYMVAPAMRTRLMKQVDSNGRRIYPEIRKGELLGYPLVENVDQSAASGGVAVVFGSVKRAVLAQSVTPWLVVSAERYAEFYQIFYAFHHRMGVKLQDSNAVTALKLA
jgi:HK97 family phage major capsid protein